MLKLIGSILSSSYLTLSFKWAEKWKLSRFQVIVFNYWTCVFTGSLMNDSLPIKKTHLSQPWFLWSLLMGGLFISLFNVIGYSAQKIGVATTSVANKLSLIIPFLFSIYLYNDPYNAYKLLGVALALISVILTCWPTITTSSSKNHSKWIFPIILFIGSGLLDTLIKYVESHFLNPTNENDYLVTSFAAAAFIGSCILILQIVKKKDSFSWQSLLMGIAIGIPNYFSIWFLVKVLKEFSNNSPAIIPINNMGIVLFSTLMAGWIFDEKLGKINWLGVILAIISIALIAFS